MALFRLLKLSGFALAISLFIALTIIVAGIGAFFPSVFSISSPIICSGHLQIESRDYSYKPGQSGTEHKIYCERRGGEISEDVTIYAVIVSGLIYSILLFPFILTGLYVLPTEKIRRFKKSRNRPSNIKIVQSGSNVKNNSQRLRELEDLRQSGLITEQEYKSKRTEILRDL